MTPPPDTADGTFPGPWPRQERIGDVRVGVAVVHEHGEVRRGCEGQLPAQRFALYRRRRQVEEPPELGIGAGRVLRQQP